jgi:MarR-like DNA-binding transcriptional regulator SgrR of sgrS sRNA
MLRSKILITTLFLILGTKGGALSSQKHNPTNEVRTYMAFTLPIDPANVKTLVDLDFSYALGMTLVDWSSNREITSALADSWTFTGDKEVNFKLNPKLKWSDGTTITASDFVSSLNRAKQVHFEDLKSLFEQVESFGATDSHTVAFKLKTSAGKTGFIRKLTEPMYGLVALTADGQLDLKRSAGPYTVEKVSAEEISLVVNKNWLFYDSAMVRSVVIRRPPKAHEPIDAIMRDPWVNLITGSSFMPSNLENKLKTENLRLWNRHLDRVFFFSPSPRLHNEMGRNLLKVLNQKISREKLTKGFSGFHYTNQFFPPGYVLHDPNFQFKNPDSKIQIPEQFSKKPLIFLGAETRIDETQIKNISLEIKKLLGVEPIFKIVPLNKFESTRIEGDYDLLAGALPVGDPNVEGAIGFIFGLNPSIIPNAGLDGEQNFKAQIDKASKLEEPSQRTLIYKKIFTSAVDEGCILPLYQYSNVVITKKGLDLSKVPTTDETVSFAKVRIKE